MMARLRDGTPVETYDGEKKIITFLYEHPLGQQLLKVLVQPWVSRLAGAFLSSGLSSWLVGPFVRKNKLDLSDYPQTQYHSFNDFFSRSILPERRPWPEDQRVLAAPCDGKLTVAKIGPDSRFLVKGVVYSVDTLLGNETLAKKYEGGMMLLFRLSVDDYHRYAWPVPGVPGQVHRIPGVFHTVNPLAAEKRAIYRENTREYTLLQTQCYGTVVMMEVGALLVGRIHNHPVTGPVHTGQEKGYFQFGGSSIVLLLEPGRAVMDEDIVTNSRNGEETVVRMGERIGCEAENQTSL